MNKKAGCGGRSDCEFQECDNRYVKKIWLYTRIIVILVTLVSAGGVTVFATGSWTTNIENEIQGLTSDVNKINKDIIALRDIQKNIDTLKTEVRGWLLTERRR
jgi:hypothetical protein